MDGNCNIITEILLVISYTRGFQPVGRAPFRDIALKIYEYELSNL